VHSPFWGIKIVFVIFVEFCVINKMVMLFWNILLGILKLLITSNHIMFKAFHVRYKTRKYQDLLYTFQWRCSYLWSKTLQPTTWDILGNCNTHLENFKNSLLRTRNKLIYYNENCPRNTRSLEIIRTKIIYLLFKILECVHFS
jgi:hypothetical protein